MATETEIDLKPFCDLSGMTRYAMSEPYFKGGKTYATDGRILIRLDKCEQPDSPADVKFPNCESVFEQIVSDGPFIPIPDSLEWKRSDSNESLCRVCLATGLSKVPCEPRKKLVYRKECGGTGEGECPHCHQDTECEECGGVCKVLTEVCFEDCPHCEDGSTELCKVDLSGVDFDWNYLRIIKELPSVVYGITRCKTAMRFEFDGGCGALMCVAKK